MNFEPIVALAMSMLIVGTAVTLGFGFHNFWKMVNKK